MNRPGAQIAIGEWLVKDDPTKPANGLMFVVNMLLHREQGDTFSFDEIKSWLEEAGFKKVRKLHVPGPSSLVMATRP